MIDHNKIEDAIDSYFKNTPTAKIIKNLDRHSADRAKNLDREDTNHTPVNNKELIFEKRGKRPVRKSDIVSSPKASNQRNKPVLKGDRHKEELISNNKLEQRSNVRKITLTGSVAVRDLAKMLLVPETEIVKKLFFQGIAISVTQILGVVIAKRVSESMGVEAVIDVDDVQDMMTGWYGSEQEIAEYEQHLDETNDDYTSGDRSESKISVSH
jgi:hypothetical protein